MGLPVVGRWVVGDVPDQISGAVESALGLADLVLVTGGLGPTPDDLTRETVAGLMTVPLDLDTGLLERLEARFLARGYGTLPERSMAMARVPRGASVLPNPFGAAPGLVLQAGGGKLCILLPGVPREMKGIFQEGVRSLLLNRYAGRLRAAVHRVIHTVGVPESILMAQLQDLLPQDMGGVSLAYLPDRVGVRIRLTARAEGDPSEGDSRLRQMESRLAPVLSRYRYDAPTGDLAEAVGIELIRRGDSLAVAESCTGGLVAKRVTDIPGSSRYFVGGMVAYANELKIRALGVPEDLIQRSGVVSESVAGALAEAAARTLNASVGLGVTGIAGPGGGSRISLWGRSATPSSVAGGRWYDVNSSLEIGMTSGLGPPMRL